MNKINYKIDTKGKQNTNVSQLENNISAIERILNALVEGICSGSDKGDLIKQILKMNETEKMCKLRDSNGKAITSDCKNNNDKIFDYGMLDKLYGDLTSKKNGPSINKMCKSKKLLTSVNYYVGNYVVPWGYHSNYSNYYKVSALPVARPIVTNKLVDSPPDFNVEILKGGGNKESKIINLVEFLKKSNQKSFDLMCVVKNGKTVCKCNGCDEYLLKSNNLRNALIDEELNLRNIVNNIEPAMLTSDEYHLIKDFYQKYINDKRNK